MINRVGISAPLGWECWNMVSFSSQMLSLSLFNCSQVLSGFGLLYTLFVPFVLICFL